jgi:hypothetical protein
MMMSLDCLIGEKDVQATIERDEFETAAAPLVAQAVRNTPSSSQHQPDCSYLSFRLPFCKSCSPSAT